MPYLFRIFGALWACIGILNVYMYFDGDRLHNSPELSILGNGLLFVIPGLILIGIGELIDRRRRKP